MEKAETPDVEKDVEETESDFKEREEDVIHFSGAVDISSLGNADELIKLPLSSLHPTQLAVGRQQVNAKREIVQRKMKKKKPKKLEKFLKEHPIPVVVGPGGVLYMIDHHHLGSALVAEGIEETYIAKILDLSSFPTDVFWAEMMSRHYIWPYDEQGRKLGGTGVPGLIALAVTTFTHPPAEFIERLPSSLTDMKDDPYRSLAGLVRKAGGYEKKWAPFAEFKWANYFRTRVSIAADQSPDHPDVMSLAMVHARGAEAGQAGLPGYLGSAHEAHPEK
eukprot:gene5795-6076_t